MLPAEFNDLMERHSHVQRTQLAIQAMATAVCKFLGAADVNFLPEQPRVAVADDTVLLEYLKGISGKK